MDILIENSIFLTETIFDLYVLAIFVRILFQLTETDARTPFKTFIFSLTDIPLKFIEKITPKIGRVHTGTILFVIIVKMIELTLLNVLSKTSFHIIGLIMRTVTDLFMQLLDLFFYLINDLNHPANGKILQPNAL